jgi:hypothetical protein
MPLGAYRPVSQTVQRHISKPRLFFRPVCVCGVPCFYVKGKVRLTTGHEDPGGVLSGTVLFL